MKPSKPAVQINLEEVTQDKPTIRTRFDRKRVSLSFPAMGKTRQDARDECNINKIMAKYQKTGIINFTNKNQPFYGNVEALDFQTALNVIQNANELFEQMPSSMRKRFQNSPHAFLDFVQDPANRQEAITLGLINKPTETGSQGARAPSEPAKTAGGEAAKAD
jgi:phage internal scaffolding protein